MSITLNIGGMSCQHCVKHVTNALQELVGVTDVEVSLESNSARVEHDGSVALEAMREAVVEAGYTVA